MYRITPKGTARIDNGGSEPMSAAWMVTFCVYLAEGGRACTVHDFTQHARDTLQCPAQSSAVIQTAMYIIFFPEQSARRAIELGWIQ